MLLSSPDKEAKIVGKFSKGPNMKPMRWILVILTGILSIHILFRHAVAQVKAQESAQGKIFAASVPRERQIEPSLSGSGSEQSQAPKTPYPEMAPVEQYRIANREDEIALARSAGPGAVSDKAEILVLGAHGYETAVKGSNGFVCYVERSWGKDFDQPEFWNPKIRTPVCLNAAAASSVLPEFLKRAQWVLAGISKDEMLARTKAALAAHEIGSPAPGSMAYMLSKDQYINDPQPGAESRWYPHVMFFVPATEASTWGANVRGGPIFSTTSDVEPITTFFVLAPRWSDGSLGPYVPVQAPTTAKPETHRHH
jgi:hypothetical protein